MRVTQFSAAARQSHETPASLVTVTGDINRWVAEPLVLLCRRLSEAF